MAADNMSGDIMRIATKMRTTNIPSFTLSVRVEWIDTMIKIFLALTALWVIIATGIIGGFSLGGLLQLLLAIAMSITVILILLAVMYMVNSYRAKKPLNQKK